MTETSHAAARALVCETPDDLIATLHPGAALIGVDHGVKNIGLAISDVRLRIASPLCALRRGKFAADAQALSALAAERGAGGFVIGLPLNMDGSHGPRAQASRAFARNLARALGLPIALWDERMSTMAVERTLMSADASRKRRAELVDKMAATYILQGCLDRIQWAARIARGDEGE